MLLLTTPGGVTVHGQGSETTRSEGRKEQQAQAPTSRQRREGQASTRDDRARIPPFQAQKLARPSPPASPAHQHYR